MHAVNNNTITRNNKYTLFSRNLLVESDGTILMTLYEDWKMNVFKLPPSSTSPLKSSFVLKQKSSGIDNSLGFALIHDDYN